MYKKIAILIFTVVAFASCGTSKKAATAKKGSFGLQNEIIDYGKKYIGKPYRYAGKGPNSFDCSGFTSYVFRKFGYTLSPSSSGQDRQVPSIRRKKDLTKGDLVFFEGRRHNGNVGHVGIVTETRGNGEFKFIHASTQYGVIVSSSEEAYYASRYLRGGRILDDRTLAAYERKEKDKEPSSAPSAKERKPMDDPKKMTVFTPAAADQHAVAAVSPVSDAPRSADVSEPVILVQTDPLKNEQAAHRKKPIETPPDTIVAIVKQAVIRDDSTLPKPAEQSIPDHEPGAFLSHEVKMGETLYSISRHYRCTIDQLRMWNPQLGAVLQAGQTLRIAQ